MAIVLITHCFDADEAFLFIEGQLLALIIACLATGAEFNHLGALFMSGSVAAPQLKGLLRVVIFCLIYLFTCLLTELVSNKVGLPLNLSVGLIAPVLIPYILPL